MIQTAPITKPLFVSFQKVGIDLYVATSTINVSLFQQKRENADEAMKEAWKRAHRLAIYSVVELLIPRTARKQRNWDNPPAENAEEYFRRSIYIPFTDHITSDLCTRFKGHNAVLIRVFCFVPKFIHSYKLENIPPGFTIYSDFLESPEEVEGEFLV